MNITRIIWGVLALLVFLWFYTWISIPTYHAAPMALSILGGLLFSICLMQAVCGFKNMYDANPDPSERDWRHKLFPVWGVSILIMASVFTMHYTNMEKQELKKNGIKVPAVLITGTSKGSESNILVEFKTVKGKRISANVDVTPTEFKRLHQYQKVEVVYAPQVPTLFRLLTDDQNIAEYIGMQSRDLNLQDLHQLLAQAASHPDSIGVALNLISYKWTLEKGEDSAVMWTNSNKQEVIMYTSAQSLVYITGNATVLDRLTPALKAQQYTASNNRPLNAEQDVETSMALVRATENHPELAAKINKPTPIIYSNASHMMMIERKKLSATTATIITLQTLETLPAK